MPRSNKESISGSSNDGNWEDVSEQKASHTEPISRSSSPAGSSRSSRKRLGNTVYIAASPRKQYSSSAVSRKPKPSRRAAPKKEEPVNAVREEGNTRRKEWGASREKVLEVLSTGISYTAQYAADVVGTSIRLLRRPLSILLFVYFLFLILGKLSQTIRSAFMPLCVIPGISSSTLCVGTTTSSSRGNSPKWADYPKLVDVQSATFEQLLDDSVGGSGLALDIKKAEMATSDLVTVVRVSDLTSRDLIANSLGEFVDDAKKTGRGLQKLSSKIGGAVDGIMAINDYALNTIEAATSNSPSLLRSLWPFPNSPPPDQAITDTFGQAMDYLSGQMKRLIVEAEASLAQLDQLEERLSTLHDIVLREDSSLSSAKAELLSELWTKLGGNRRKVRGYNQNLFLLKNLGDYRKRALVHVVSALQTLTALSEDMEDLRERVAAPELAGARIPVEVHMKSIKNGLERLREGRIKAKEREEEAVRRILTLDSD